MTRDTVFFDTRAMRATSLIVGRLRFSPAASLPRLVGGTLKT
jgi:hypothetical protein